jgi:hypothetical protein
MIMLSDGTWLAGASNEQGMWNAFFDRSEDEGKTWKPHRIFRLIVKK